MCGIAGVLGGQRSELAVGRMLDAQVHRGPDGRGVEVLRDEHGRVCGALGSRRLAILDLSSTGRQPMRSDGPGHFLFSYNGEVYNHEELRSELTSAGEAFRGRADTEVVFRGLVRWGIPFLSRLRGMFALAFWDASAGQLTLARDPLGIKPLYVARVGGSFLFASEVRALLETGRLPRRLAPGALLTYLSDGAIREPLTAIEGIWQLPAGTLLHVTIPEGGIQVGSPQAYGTNPFQVPSATLSDPREAALRVRRTLQASVDRHLRADVPLGILLSGGLDSATVAALAGQAMARAARLQTVTVAFPGSALDESLEARAVADQLGSEHHEARLDDQQILELLPAALRAMDQPTSDGINTFVACHAARTVGLRVVLSGLGGDELFAAYPSFRRAYLLASVWRVSSPLRRLLARAWRRGGVRWEKVQALAQEEDPARAAFVVSRLLFGPSTASRLRGGSVDGKAARERAPHHLSVLGRVRWYELTNYTRDMLLRDSDVFSMAHGIELRVPFLDVEVIRAVQAIDDGLLRRNGVPKRVLADALAPLLSSRTFRRQKRGFELPFDAWMRGPLGGWIERTLSSDAVERVGLEGEAVRDIWGLYLTGCGGLTWTRPWALFCLVRWAEAHDLSLSEQAVPAIMPEGWSVS